MRRGFLLALVAAAAIAATYTGYACFMRAPQPIQVWLDEIEVDITNQVAVKRYKCVFLNPNPQAVVGGMCYMELDPDAQVDNVHMQVGDQKVKGEILDLDKANQVFANIVRNGGSPALLEYYGNKLIRTRVPRVPPRGTVTVHLQYTTVLQAKDNLVRISMLNTNPKAKLQALKKAAVKVTIKNDVPVTNVYSPTHDIKVKEAVGQDALVATWEQENYLPKTPFVMYYALSKKHKVGASTLAYREDGDERGYFMTMIAPAEGGGKQEQRINESDIQPKDVVFCVDTSFSMNEDGKIDQARKGLRYCVTNLREGDRFNIVDFSTEARSFSPKLTDAGITSIKRAQRYIEDLEASGGTAIHDALSTALAQFGDDKRLKMIVFMTDGLPTIGERDPQQILKDITKGNSKDVRLFVFGEGYDVNTRLLDTLAVDNRGDSDYILPKEDIAKRIASFFDKVGSPVMTDLEISIDGVKRSDIYPRQMPDLFKGDQVIVYGRYDITGERKLTLTGTVNGQRQRLEYTVDFPATSEKNDFVPRLWGGQKVNHLLQALRKKGENDEMIAEVVSLSKRFGIVTPYTAYLINDDEMRRPQAQAGQNALASAGRLRRKLKAEADGAGAAPAKAPEREKMAADAAALGWSRRAAAEGKVNRLDEARDARAGERQEAMQRVRYIGSKTFYYSDGVWYDSRFDPSKDKTTDMAIAGEDYMAFLAANKGVSKYLALGQAVIKVGGKWYRFTPRAKK